MKMSLVFLVKRNAILDGNIEIALRRDLSILLEFSNLDWSEVASKIELEPHIFTSSKNNEENISIEENFGVVQLLLSKRL